MSLSLSFPNEVIIRMKLNSRGKRALRDDINKSTVTICLDALAFVLGCLSLAFVIWLSPEHFFSVGILILTELCLGVLWRSYVIRELDLKLSFSESLSLLCLLISTAIHLL